MTTDVQNEDAGYDELREAVEAAYNRSQRVVTLPTKALLRVLPSDPDASIHAILVKHCIALREDIVRDIALYLFGPHRAS